MITLAPGADAVDLKRRGESFRYEYADHYSEHRPTFEVVLQSAVRYGADEAWCEVTNEQTRVRFSKEGGSLTGLHIRRRFDRKDNFEIPYMVRRVSK